MSRLALLPVSLPESWVPEGTDPASVANECFNIFENLSEKDFIAQAIWRDSYALTGTLRTFYTSQGVFSAWSQTAAHSKPHSFSVDACSAQLVALPGGSSWIEIPYVFETASEPPLICTAILSVINNPADKKWRIWVMKTVLDQIKGAPDVDVYDPSSKTNLNTKSVQNGDGSLVDGHSSGHDQSTFDCVIVGAGQAGLNTAGRCQALGISYVLLDKNKQVGDNWRQRYNSARLHTIREYSHLPFERTFKEEYPEFLGKDDLAKGYQSWVEKYHINTWLDTTFLSGAWKPEEKRWRLRIKRGGSSEQELNCAFVIMAVGAGGQVPLLPELPGRETFHGTVLHSEQYTSAEAWAGKPGIVVGTANTAHDVAEDMVEANLASTTMVQRSETYVLPVEWYIKAQERTYNATFPTPLADKLTNAHPHAVMRLISMVSMHAAARREPERFDALKRVGFRVNVFGDPLWHLLERLGGHYMDVGASAKIAQGLIKMKSDAAPTHYTEHGLGFSDGTELPADIIVFATGFDLNIRNRVRDAFGEDVAKEIGDFSVMDDEGEMSGAWRFQHPGLACHGGAIGQSRWYSRFLALTMKAALMGTPLKVYMETPYPPKKTEDIGCLQRSYAKENLC